MALYPATWRARYEDEFPLGGGLLIFIAFGGLAVAPRWFRTVVPASNVALKAGPLHATDEGSPT